MAPTRTVPTPGTQTLAEFQRVVQQQEGIFGPLKTLGREGENNTITLEIAPAPVNRALLEVYRNDQPPPKVGHTIICTAECLVEGQLAKIVAYRLT